MVIPKLIHGKRGLPRKELNILNDGNVVDTIELDDYD